MIEVLILGAGIEKWACKSLFIEKKQNLGHFVAEVFCIFVAVIKKMHW